MGMDLVDLIQTRRFLGSEFLMWLWYKCEVFESRFNIGDKPCEVWFDQQITLEAFIVETEQSKLRGASPTLTPEAKEALRQGKLATQAKLRIVHDGQEFGFVFKAPDFQLSGVKIPALMSREEDEKFYERMYLIETLEGLIAGLYDEFLGLRLRDAWEASMLPALQRWVQEDALLEVEAYRALREANPPLPRRERSTQRAAADGSAAGAEASAEASSEAPVEEDAPAPELEETLQAAEAALAAYQAAAEPAAEVPEATA